MKGIIIGGILLLIVMSAGGWYVLSRNEVAPIVVEEAVVDTAPAASLPTAAPTSAAAAGNGAVPSLEPTSASAPVKNLAPNFTLEKLSGGTITLSSYRGQKPVILDFWASWCHNCQRDMPRLSAWYDQYQDHVEVIGVNLQEQPAKAQRYVDSAGISFPIALDPDAVASGAYGITYTNMHVLINRDGSLSKVIPGDISEEDIVALIASNE